MRLHDKPATTDELVQQLLKRIEELEYRIADLETCQRFTRALLIERGEDG